MTSISSTTTQAMRPPPPPPGGGGRSRIDDRIQQGVSTGSISATDATALTSALDSIDTSLSSDATGSTSSSTGSVRASRPDPAAMKEKIDGLIADQVSAGSLTSAQADTLTSLFASGGKGDAAGGGPGGVGGPGGPPPVDAASGGSGSRSSSGTASDGSDANAAASRLLSDFLSQLQANLASGSGYGATGTSSGNRTATSLVMDFDA